ncbi:N-acyl homoserine lactonase family protein [Rhodococcus sp. NPDC057297]|jgi:glyoxylase-like metal-dependent hydrolase (beta-lactamase superfamily II)|uniref:N-acyl homoserine lactonase family protein n=1 Tax=Rhodococcus sp. NPDC057297 TaxID=3346090 RepID=UPI003628F683
MTSFHHTSPTAAAIRPSSDEYFRLYAVQYASRTGTREQHFHYCDGRGQEPHPTAYYVWLAVSASHTILVDAGISPETAAGMDGLDYHGSPLELVAALGIAADRIDLSILTHLHYDHTGIVADLPEARYVLQADELEYWTGPWARRIVREQWLNSEKDVAHLRSVGDRLQLVDGDAELLPGISVHRVGGHTAGMQVVRVKTADGYAVVASDASHFYENIENDSPFAILHDVPGMYYAFDRINELADSPSLVVPGHDPEVAERHALLDAHPDAHAFVIG